MPDPFLASYLSALRRDIQEIVAWSEDRFGVRAADRYGLLIRQALRDVLEEPTRPGAMYRPDLAPDAYVYHLSFSRDRGRRSGAGSASLLALSPPWPKG